MKKLNVLINEIFIQLCLFNFNYFFIQSNDIENKHILN